MPRMIVTLLTGGTSASTTGNLHNPGCTPGHPCPPPTWGGPPTFTPPTLPPPTTFTPPVTLPPTGGYPTPTTPGVTYPPTTDTLPTTPPATNTPPTTDTPPGTPPPTTTVVGTPTPVGAHLPVTGDPTGAIVGIGAGLLLLGSVLYTLGRKRLSRDPA